MGDNTVKVTGYEIGCLLGQGTQGCVYKAITRGPERKPVAVKVDLQSTQSYKMMLSLDSGEITNLPIFEGGAEVEAFKGWPGQPSHRDWLVEAAQTSLHS